ncbi:MAG: O-methyltransferase [Lachnospiraceae bacterium]|nr:O-methyltransferase [Lachnospiraceae bacterium]
MIISERLSEYIKALECDLPEYLDELEQRALADEVPIIRKEAQALLRFLLCLLQPDRILEVGCAVGFSAAFMSEYMPEHCTITTIEKVEMRIREAKKNLASIPYADKVTLLCGDANDVLRDLAEQGNTYPFIFMDAAKGQYMNFLPYLLKLLPEGGILITDNVLQEGTIVESKYTIPRRERTIHMRMREYVYALKHMEELETVVLPVGDGVTLSVKRTDKNAFFGKDRTGTEKENR